MLHIYTNFVIGVFLRHLWCSDVFLRKQILWTFSPRRISLQLTIVALKQEAESENYWYLRCVHIERNIKRKGDIDFPFVVWIEWYVQWRLCCRRFSVKSSPLNLPKKKIQKQIEGLSHTTRSQKMNKALNLSGTFWHTLWKWMWSDHWCSYKKDIKKCPPMCWDGCPGFGGWGRGYCGECFKWILHRIDWLNIFFYLCIILFWHHLLGFKIWR